MALAALFSLAALVGTAVYLRAVSAEDPATGRSASPTSPSTTTAGGLVPDERLGRIDEEYSGSGEATVAVVGDSLTVGSRDDLEAELTGYRVKIAALFGEGFGGGPISYSFDRELLSEAVDDYLDDPEPPDALVVALGTNNAWLPALTLDMFEEDWPEMIAGYEGDCLVVVTVTEDSAAAGYDSDEAAAINRALRDGADRVVDWAQLDVTALTQPDQIHLNAEGSRRRAGAIAEAVRSCDLQGAP